eukprot:Skav207109  [mRNA]  locus=scaffold156:134700:135634:- [translate_table: standard]
MVRLHSGERSRVMLVLVLAPTRELVIQISTVAAKLTERSRGTGGLTVAAVYGGTRKQDQLAQLRQRRSLHVLVATVGRLLDTWQQGRGSKCSPGGFRASLLLVRAFGAGTLWPSLAHGLRSQTERTCHDY